MRNEEEESRVDPGSGAQGQGARPRTTPRQDSDVWTPQPSAREQGALNPRPSTLDPSGRRRANRKATIIGVQVFIGLALLIAVVGGLWDQAQQPQETSGMAQVASAAGIPAQIAGLPRAETMTGPQAMAEIRELHGKEVGLARGWIAHYGQNATVWFGEARDEATAIGLIDAMTGRIRAGNQYFKNLQEIQVNGRQVFSVFGQGQRHYYYRQRRQVIWLAVPDGREEAFLKEALVAIK